MVLCLAALKGFYRLAQYALVCFRPERIGGFGQDFERKSAAYDGLAQKKAHRARQV